MRLVRDDAKEMFRTLRKAVQREMISHAKHFGTEITPERINAHLDIELDENPNAAIYRKIVCPGCFVTLFNGEEPAASVLCTPCSVTCDCCRGN